ncbi:MAG: hypothetical protein QOE44_297 [Solirubrobacteraceae bacterium]|nr:hypothetical protein [Solirubrobacteraceae bacterium]
MAAAVGLVVGLAGAGPTGALVRSETPAVWQVAGVGPGQRSLDIIFTVGGCLGPGARATVREIRTSVTLTVREDAPTRGGLGQACPLFVGQGTLHVPLAARLAGRRVLGQSPVGSFIPTGLVVVAGKLRYKVPRLIGFAPGDARRALASDPFHPVVTQRSGGRGMLQVIAQAPAPGTPLGAGGVVRLRIGRR